VIKFSILIPPKYGTSVHRIVIVQGVNHRECFHPVVLVERGTEHGPQVSATFGRKSSWLRITTATA
jgi:hypothetical protein